MIEIERKFLVKSLEFKLEAQKSYNIIQGFLNTHKERTVRVRIKEDSGFITVKGVSSDDGLSRFEWEKEIPFIEAEALLKIAEPGVISKRRFEVSYRGYIFEVDEFFEDNQGLIVAEVELKTDKDVFEKPKWLGKEITGETKYYNSKLSLNPFKDWKK